MRRFYRRLRREPRSRLHAQTGRVKLLKKIKINDKWKLATALFDSKGRVRRDHVNVEGKDELHPEGTYYLEWWSRGERSREAAGPDAFIAAERARHKQAELSADAQRPARCRRPRSKPGTRHRQRRALTKYEDYIRYHRSLRTFRTYRPILTPSVNSAPAPTSTRSSAGPCWTSLRAA